MAWKANQSRLVPAILLLMLFFSHQGIFPVQTRSFTQGANAPANSEVASDITELGNSEVCEENGMQESSVSAATVTRSAGFTFSNRTLPQFPSRGTISQKSSPANDSLVSEMVGLTIAQPTAWRNFSISASDGFLAIDGASQSAVLLVLIEIYSPGSFLKVRMNTTSSQALHYVEEGPTIGEWGIHMRLTSTGNTTVWIQALSPNKGIREVVDYHKEITHLYAGQAAYFRISLTTNDWFDIHSRKFAGGYMNFEAFLPTDFVNPWQSSFDYYDGYLASAQAPQLGTYLFVARDYPNSGADADILIQITKKAAVTRTLFPNAKMALEFNLTYENEYFIVNLNQTYQWLALDGGVTSSGSTVYWLRDPAGSIVANLNSYSSDYPVSQMVIEPDIGNYLLVLQGSEKGTVCIAQLTVNSFEETYLSAKSDNAIYFQQTGQTVYYSINVTAKSFFIFSGSSEKGLTIYRIHNFRNEQIWSGQSWSVINAQYILQVPVGSKYLLSVQGRKSSVALIHLRFNGDYDYSISSPDYSDFEMRFAGDFLLYQLIVPDVAYITQYWHNLAPAYVVSLIYDANYVNQGSLPLSGQGSEYRLLWRKNIESFAPGNWVIFITGEKCQYLRASQLRAGNEERDVNTPFHVFETFDFDYQAKTSLVEVSASLWFSAIAAMQTSGTSYLRIYDSRLTNQWDVGVWYPDYNYFRCLAHPEAGSWLMMMDGVSSSNVSLTFQTSSDPLINRTSGQYYTDEFRYKGEGGYYCTQIGNASFLGLDAMGLANDLQTDIYLIDPTAQIPYYAYSRTKFAVNHYFTPTPQNGNWSIVLIGSPRSKIIYRVTKTPDQSKLLPFVDSFSSDFDGKITYVSFVVSRLERLSLNATNNIDSDSSVWLHSPNGQLWYQYQFTYRNQFVPITIWSPADGEWSLCIIQEIFANLTIAAGATPTKPEGIFIQFIYPPDAQIYNLNGTEVVLPEANGTIIVVAEVTDYYHQISYVSLYFNGGLNFTNMGYNPLSHFYEAPFDTTPFPDGLYELVIYAQCQASEFGVGSISIRINNHGTFPPIDDTTPPSITEVHRDPEIVSDGESPLIWAVVADRDTAVSLVILSYSVNNGAWENITMSARDKLTFQGQIPGFSAGSEVAYSIIAYDYVQNKAVDDNAGSYYVYSVVPEFPSFLIFPLFAVVTWLAIIVSRRMKRATYSGKHVHLKNVDYFPAQT